MRLGVLALLLTGIGCEMEDRGQEADQVGGIQPAEPVLPAEPVEPVEPVLPAEPPVIGERGVGTDDVTPGTNGVTPGTAVTTPPTTAESQAMNAKILSDLHQDNVHEIALARLAADKATTPELKEYANDLVQAHTRADEQLVKLARDEGINLDEASQSQNQAQLATFERLRGLSGSAFDQEYLKVVIDAHDQTLTRVQTTLTSVQDEDVRNYLDKLVPDMRKLQEDARKITPPPTGS